MTSRSGHMMGLGIDIIEVSRIESVLRRHRERFLDRVYRPGEIAYAQASSGKQFERLAVRWAAKEAALKALGTGLRAGIRMQDIEMVQDANGAPSLVFHGQALEWAKALGIEDAWVSVSHSGDLAVAVVSLTRTRK